MMKACRQPTITEAMAREIERRAHGLMRGDRRRMHLALTEAAKAVLECKPRRAIKGEGSLNYVKSIGRFRWD